MVDVILDGSVNTVVNTVSGEREPMKDSFQIRRATVERRIPCYTSLDTAWAAVNALLNGATRFNVLPHREYLESSLTPKEARDTEHTLRDVTTPAMREEAR